MTYYDEQLRELNEKISRKKLLEKTLDKLNIRREQLEKRVSGLEKISAKEQKDVERMEGGSLSAFFCGIMGKQAEKLDKEREEAYAAAVKYDAAAQELDSVNEEIARCEEELKPLWYCEQDYQKALAEKCVMIKNSGSPEGAEILETEKNISALEIYAKEITEAISAGKKARRLAEEIVDILDEAERYARIALNGRASSANRVKYARVDEAQEKMHQLQVQLGRFRAELVNVEVDVFDIEMDKHIGFINRFGLRCSELEKINEIQCSAQEIRSKIAYANAMLEDTLKDTEKKRALLINELENKILES